VDREKEFAYFSVRLGSPKGLESLQYPETAFVLSFFATLSAYGITTAATNESATKALTTTLVPTRTPASTSDSPYLLLRLLRQVLDDLLLRDVPSLPAPALSPASVPSGVGPRILTPAAARVEGGGRGVPPAAAGPAVAAAPAAAGRVAGIGGCVRVGRRRAAPPALAVAFRHVGDGSHATRTRAG
jgi:hypothetical protein